TNNSFDTESFSHSAGASIKGYAVANYVPEGVASLDGTTGTLTASCNWLGTADAFEIADNAFLSGRILNKDGAVTNVTPFITSGADGNTAMGFQPGGACVGVGPVRNVNTNITYLTIQQAIDAAQTLDGHMIEVSAGTYPENVLVNKSLTINGANAGLAGNDPSRGAESIVIPSTSDIEYGILFDVTANDVVIDGFTMNGDNPSITTGYSSTNGADMDCSEGVTVYVNNISGLQVRNNVIEDLSYFGVTLFGASYSAPATSGHVISGNLM